MSERYKDFRNILKNIEQSGLDDAILECFPINFYRQQWNEFSEDPELTDQMIIKYSNFLNWNVLSGTYNFSLDFLQCWEDKINWPIYSSNPHITEQIIRYYKDKLLWMNVIIAHNFDLDFVREFKDYIDFSFMIRNSNEIGILINIINEFKEKFDQKDWEYISYFNSLNDCFIEKNIERLNLDQVQKHCKQNKIKLKIKQLNKIQRKLKYA